MRQYDILIIKSCCLSLYTVTMYTIWSLISPNFCVTSQVPIIWWAAVILATPWPPCTGHSYTLREKPSVDLICQRAALLPHCIVIVNKTTLTTMATRVSVTHTKGVTREECDSSVLKYRIECVLSQLHGLVPWRWKQFVTPEHWYQTTWFRTQNTTLRILKGFIFDSSLDISLV